MEKRFCFTVLAGCIFLVVGIWGTSITATAGPSTMPLQQAPTRFLEPSYYGTQEIWCVFDHFFPDLGENGVVMHYDGTENGSWPRNSYDGHRGIDYSLQYEMVRAAAPGTVAQAGWASTNHRASYGLHVRIDHDIDQDGQDDYRTIYGHMSVLRVKTDDEIYESGEFQRILGISGNTGWCAGQEGTGEEVWPGVRRCTDADPPTCGAHLHFQIEDNGIVVNPYEWIGGDVDERWENDDRGTASHDGIDYDLESELVRAVAPGDVQYAGWRDPANHQDGEGLYVRVHHDNGYQTFYGHISVLCVQTQEG